MYRVETKPVEVKEAALSEIGFVEKYRYFAHPDGPKPKVLIVHGGG